MARGDRWPTVTHFLNELLHEVEILQQSLHRILAFLRRPRLLYLYPPLDYSLTIRKSPTKTRAQHSNGSATRSDATGIIQKRRKRRCVAVSVISSDPADAPRLVLLLRRCARSASTSVCFHPRRWNPHRRRPSTDEWVSFLNRSLPSRFSSARRSPASRLRRLASPPPRHACRRPCLCGFICRPSLVGGGHPGRGSSRRRIGWTAAQEEAGACRHHTRRHWPCIDRPSPLHLRAERLSLPPSSSNRSRLYHCSGKTSDVCYR